MPKLIPSNMPESKRYLPNVVLPERIQNHFLALTFLPRLTGDAIQRLYLRDIASYIERCSYGDSERDS